MTAMGSGVCSAYFTVNGTDAVTFSQAISNLPRVALTVAASARVSAILSISTGDAGLPIVMAVRPNSVAGLFVVLPSLLMPHCGLALAVGELLVHDQLPISLVDIDIQRVLALGHREAADVQVGVGMKDRRVIRTLRRIASLTRWEEQRERWREVLAGVTSSII